LRKHIATAWALVFLVLMGLTAGAAEPPAIEVLVLDAVSKAPVPFARVVLQGPSAQVGFSDEQGTARFESVVAGSYVVSVRRKGYHMATSASFEVGLSGSSTVDVALAPVSAPKEIGRVRARAPASVRADSLDSKNTFVKLNDSGLADTLGSFGDIANGFASIDGRGATQTDVTIDGVSLHGPGLGTDLRGLNVDLFNGASTSSPSQITVGSVLSLVTLEPTLATQSSTVLSYASQEKSSWKTWTRGTIGSIGWVETHVSSGADGNLANKNFLDSSGRTYVHRQGTNGSGDLLKIRVPFSAKTSLSVTGFLGSRRSDDICDRFTAIRPCGIGPRNQTTVSEAGIVGVAQSQIAGANIEISGLHLVERSLDDQSNRVISGLPSPQTDSFRSVVDNASITASRLDSNGLSTLRVNASRSKAAQSIGSLFSTDGGGEVSNETASISRAQDFTPKLNLYAELSFVRDFQNLPQAYTTRLTWKPTTRDLLSITGRTRGGGSSPIPIAEFRDPASLVYDCGSNHVFTSAPTQSPVGPSNVTDVNISWQRHSTNGSVAINAYNQIQRNTVANELFEGSAATAVLPADYLTAISLYFANPNVCGRVVNLNPTNVYVSEAIAGVNRNFRGINLNFARQFGDFALGGYARFTRALVTSQNSLLGGTASSGVSDRPLSGVPEWRGGMVADFKPKRGKLEYLALWQYTGTNNENNLNPYSILSFGASVDLSRGQLTLSESNIGNTNGGGFASFANAASLPTASGGRVNYPAAPLTPRSFGLSYTLRTGGAPKSTISAENIDDGSSVSSIRFTALPSSPPANPFSIDRTDPYCTPESRPQSEALLRAVKALSAEVSATSLSERESTFKNELPVGSSDVSLRVVTESGKNFAIAIEPKERLLGIACVSFSAAGESQDARDVGLPFDSKAGKNINFYFTPRFGFYVVFGKGTLVASISSANGDVPPEGDLLALRTECPANQRPFVKQVTAEIVQGSNGVDTLSSVTGASIKYFSEGGASFTSVSFNDPLNEAIFVGCTYVRPPSPGMPSALFKHPGIIFIPGFGLVSISVSP